MPKLLLQKSIRGEYDALARTVAAQLDARTSPRIDPVTKGTGGTVSDYLQAAAASSTRRAYRADLEHFVAWGGLIPASEELVAEYIAAHAGTLAVATLQRRLAALAARHKSLGALNPCSSDIVRLVMRGIKRVHGITQRRADPLLLDHLVEICATMGGDLRAARDRALLQIGFAGAFRRSELVALNCSDLVWGLDRVTVTIRRSKTDPFGVGRKILIGAEIGPLRPVAALSEWLSRAGISEGRVFRSLAKTQIAARQLTAGSVSVIVKRSAAAAGYDLDKFSSHSLRAGFVSTAARHGLPFWAIRRQTGHRSMECILRYVRCPDEQITW